MPLAVAFFLGCCEQVIRGDETQLERLRGHGFSCRTGRWHFDLPALHAFLQQQMAEQCPDYLTFRRQLFASDCNLQLQQLGAAIVIADNRGKVDESLYLLQAL